jgi:hypothetical protein
MATDSFASLGGLIEFLEAQRGKIAGLVAEMGECQKAFTTQLVAVQQRADDAQTEALAALEGGLDAAADWLKADLAQRLPDIQAAKAKRRDELQAQIKELEGQRAEVEAQSAAELEQEKRLNPALNQREEELKGEAANQQAQIAQVDAQMAQAAAGLGWLVHFGKIRELREVRHRWEVALYATQGKLFEVRSNWQRQHDQTVDSESRLQKAWRFRTADIARYTEELQKLQDDPDGVCRREALTATLADFKEPQPTGIAAADAAIARLLQFRAQVADATQGIGDSAELIGLMNGIASGLEKFQTSVESVKKEQDMHSELSDLKLEPPAEVLQFHAIWDELLPVVKDECAACEHPRDFHAKLRAEIGEHLTDKQIEAMFVAMGNELSRATKAQWG